MIMLTILIIWATGELDSAAKCNSYSFNLVCSIEVWNVADAKPIRKVGMGTIVNAYFVCVHLVQN